MSVKVINHARHGPIGLFGSIQACTAVLHRDKTSVKVINHARHGSIGLLGSIQACTVLWFDVIVECAGMQEAVLTATVVVNRRNRPVLVTSSTNNSFAEKCARVRNRARVMLQSGSRFDTTSRRASVYAGGLTQLSRS